MLFYLYVFYLLLLWVVSDYCVLGGQLYRFNKSVSTWNYLSIWLFHVVQLSHNVSHCQGKFWIYVKCKYIHCNQKTSLKEYSICLKVFVSNKAIPTIHAWAHVEFVCLFPKAILWKIEDIPRGSVREKCWSIKSKSASLGNLQGPAKLRKLLLWATI